MPAGELAERLREQARAADHRRLLVLHGDPDAVAARAREAVQAARAPGEPVLVVGEDPAENLGLEPGHREHVAPGRADELMGTTHPLVVLDARTALDPRALGRVVGAVDGGGLLVLLAPALAAWPDREDGFDGSLAVPPYTTDDVTGRFRRRLVAALREHGGVAIYDANADAVRADGHADAGPRPRRHAPPAPADATFPSQAYDACRTEDQARAVRALGTLASGPDEEGGDALAVVVEADRGRGKSSAAGLAAGALAHGGADVLVTAPRERNTRELFARARELLDALDARQAAAGPEDEGSVAAASGGRVRYADPAAALEAAPGVDALLVDEAAGLPVHLLEQLLGAGPPAAFTTTVHGYEGAGRGFSVRFQERLADHAGPVTQLALDEPIRYAPADPLERWAFRALLLDARPPVDAVVQDATPANVEHEPLDPEALLDDEPRLREAFGLLVLAHYRTTPRDLARLLDAPNLDAHALTHDGHVVCVALVAREGGLPEDRCAELYEGGAINGHLIPDVLTSQLRDPDAGRPTGARVVRIATHPAARRRGLASRLLDDLRAHYEVDWLGTAFGATPGLLAFWQANGYRTVHLGTRRNPASGEHSAILLDPATQAGRDLRDRSARWFGARIGAVLADALRGLDPDTARAALATSAADPPAVDLDEHAWRHLAACTRGPGVYDTNPAPFRALGLAHLLADDPDAELTDEHERLIVAKVLQARPWAEVADELGYVSTRMAMRALADAYRPLVDAHGSEVAREDAERYGNG
jgi:tRNA(Met) cytidine acetyltransferase